MTREGWAFLVLAVAAVVAAVTGFRAVDAARARGAILDVLLAADRELYGHEIVASVAGLSRASVYVLLDRMEDEGLIGSRPEPEANNALIALGGVPRRLYRLKGAPCTGPT